MDGEEADGNHVFLSNGAISRPCDFEYLGVRMKDNKREASGLFNLRLFLAQYKFARIAYKLVMKTVWRFRKSNQTRLLTDQIAGYNNSLNQFRQRTQTLNSLKLAATSFIDRTFLERTYHFASDSLDAIEDSILNSVGSFGIDPNPFFDSDFYYQEHSREIDAEGLSPFTHYLWVGAWKRYLPNPLYGSASVFNLADKDYIATFIKDSALLKRLFLGRPEIPNGNANTFASVKGALSQSIFEADIAIVVPVYNNWLWTERCLRALEQCWDVDMRSVFVVDDNSSDQTLQNLNKFFPSVNILANTKNLGFLESCNGAFEVLREKEFLFLLNNDTEPHPGFLAESMSLMVGDPSTGLVGSKLIYPNDLLQEAGGIVWRDGSGWNFGGNLAPGLINSVVREVDYCSGAAILIRNRAVEGELFDRLFLPAYYEDTDLAFRLRQSGYKVLYSPFSVVVHHEGKSHGTDVETGTKKFQAINEAKFREKWKATLVNHFDRDPFGTFVAAYRLELSRRPRVVLWFDYQLPNPTTDSGSVRALKLLQIFRELDIFVIFVPQNGDVEQLDPYWVQKIGVLVVKDLTAAKQFLAAAGREPDLIVASRVSVATDVGQKAHKRYPKAKFIFDTVDLHHLRLEREAKSQDNSLLARTANTVKMAEMEMIRKADMTIVVSAFEQELLAKALPKSEIRVISNIHELNIENRGVSRRGTVFVGSFNHHPNEQGIKWFLESVWIRLPKAVREEGLLVVGPNPPKWLVNLDDENVRILGWVPDSTLYVAGAKVSIAPLLAGAGVKGKVGEAVANFTPVVGTSLAMEGMGLASGISCIVADEGDHFAAELTRLHESELLREEISRAAATTLKSKFGYEQTKHSVTQAITNLLGSDA